MAKKEEIDKGGNITPVDNNLFSSYNPGNNQPLIIGWVLSNGGKMKSLSQSQLNAIIIAAVLIIVLGIFWLVPATRIVPEVIWSIFMILVKLVWALLLAAAIFMVPFLAMYLVRIVIDFLDLSVDKYTNINKVVHFSVCALLSIVVSGLWMIYGVRFIVGLPSWINDLYHGFDLYDGLIENLPWGWGVVSLITSVIGYISGSDSSLSEN